MDFTQFTRSMLLAQGAFDTFLKADSEEKSKILEQITGTEIYSTIGRRVFERMRQEGETAPAAFAGKRAATPSCRMRRFSNSGTGSLK